MQALFNRLQAINVAALGVLALIFAGLLLEGANTAASASLLSLALLMALAVAAFGVGGGKLRRVFVSNLLSIVAAFAFFTLAIATAWPGLVHTVPEPLWSLIGDGEWPISLSPYRTWEGVVAFLAPCAAYLLGAFAGPDRRARDWVGRWVVCLALLYGFVGLYLFFAIGSPNGGRLDVGVGSANAAAALFGVFILVACALVARGVRGRLSDNGGGGDLPSKWSWAAFAIRTPVSFAATIVLFACLLLTASRGGLIASLIGFVVFALALSAQRLKQSTLRGGVALAPVIFVIGVFALLFVRGGDDVLQRFALASEDMEVRRTLTEAHWAFYLDRPLFGHGLNAYHELNALAATPENWQALSAPGSTHNIFIQVLEETGLVGLALWVLMLATPVTRALARIVRGQRGIEWAATTFAATTLLLLHGLVDFALQVPAIAALFAYILGASVGRADRQM